MKERLILAMSIWLLVVLVGGVGTYFSYGYLLGSLIESVLVIGVLVGLPGLFFVAMFLHLTSGKDDNNENK